MKRNYWVWGFAVLTILLFMQSSSMAEVQLCNVAAFKPTEGDVHPTYTWPLVRAVDELLDGVQCTCGPDTDTAYWKVNLGETFDVEHLIINSRTGNPNRINGAWLRAYDSTNTAIGSPIMLDGYACVYDDPNTPEDETNIVDSIAWDNGGAGWQGVQYFQIGGVDDLGNPLGVPYMHIMEFKAMANVDCTTYPGFIEGVTVDDGGAGYPGYWGISPDYITDGSAMTDRHGVLNSPDALSFATSSFWCSKGDINESNVPTLTFDLDGTYDLDELALWNTTQPGGTNYTRGFKDVTISTSTDGITYTEIPDANGAELGNFTFAITSEDTIIEGDTFGNQGEVDLSGITAGYVKMTVLNSHGSESYWGVSEVRFYGAAVPEPSTVVLILCGFGALFCFRKRK